MSTSLTHANRLVGWPKHVSLSDARKVEHCMSCLSLRQPRFAFAQCLTILGMMQGKLRGTVKEQLDQILKAVVRIRLETEALHPIHELFVPEATHVCFCAVADELVHDAGKVERHCQGSGRPDLEGSSEGPAGKRSSTSHVRAVCP